MLETASATLDEPTPHAAWPALLEHFYSQKGRQLPYLERLKGEEVEEPYKTLLVHSSDMTPTLENFFRQRLGLTVLGRERRDLCYYREVVLNIVQEARPVEYGVIRIYLDHFPTKARKCVLEERQPLGDILRTESIPHLSWPQAFFRVEADAHMRAVLCLNHPGFLYGRRNLLLDGSRRMLAEVIEVLAPVEKRWSR
ncbi:MAG TPA: hypothetical protein VEC99_07855 [Clostridia bacterium]|nr:hypothetical protein [Clostridia bacterium]